MTSFNIPSFNDAPWPPLFDEDDEGRAPLLAKKEDSESWEPSPEGEKEAASRVIMKAIRRSRAPVDLLRKDRSILAALPAPKFEKAVTPALEALKKQAPAKAIVEDPLRKQERIDAVIGLQHERSAFQNSHMVPVFTPKGPGIAPVCEMRKEEAFFSLPKHEGVCVTASVNPDPTHIPSKQELDALVKDLAARKDIFPWDHKQNGCEARAPVMIQFLTAMEVPKENLGKIYLSAPDQKLGWKYHVAVIVKASDGTSYVLDPSLDPEKALTVKEWSDLQLPTNAVVKNLGRKCDDFTYHPKQGILFTLNSDMMLVTADTESGEVSVAKEEDSDRAGDFVNLAEFRAKLDRNFLGQALPPTP